MVKLPFIKQKKEEKQFFLSLLIKPYRIGALLFEEQNKKLTILSTKEEIQKKEIESHSPEELVAATDSVISFVEGGLPENATVSNALFAVPYDWVEEGKIKRDYLLKLKKLCDDLALTPIGFIVSIEAIVAFLQNQAGVPLSSLLVEVAKEKVFVYVVRAGTIIEVLKDEVSESVVKTVETLLKGISSMDVLPSKIVLFDHEGVETLQQEFLSYHWTQSLPFLHLPQVVVLEKGFENEAIVNGVASQMGFDVLEEVSLHTTDREQVADEDVVGGEEFGFVKEQDVAEQPEKESEPEVVVRDHREIRKEDHEDVSTNETPDGFQLSGIMGFFRNMIAATSLSSPRAPRMSLPKGGFVLFAVLAVLCILSIGYLYYSYLLKADVTVFADKKTFNRDLQITFSSTDPTSPEKKVIHMDIVEEEVESETSSETTGKKDTGEKAKGEVTLYNKTENKKTLTKGATIVGTNNLEFKTLDDATIASTSAFSTNFSNVKVKIEAAKFGQEYNLPSSTNFTIKDTPSSQIFAKNDSAFSGGTKKTVQVVDKKDLNSLSDSLVGEVQNKAFSQASSKVGGDGVVISVPLDYEFKKRTFDKKEGDEAKSVSLTAVVLFKIGSYKKSEVDAFIQDLAKGEVPENFSLIDSESQKEVKDLKINEDSQVTSSLRVSSVYSAEVDLEKLKKDLVGKNVSDAQKILQGISGVSDSHIELKNKLPLLPDFLPMKSKNITVTVKTNG